jgi:hypothetical protein
MNTRDVAASMDAMFSELVNGAPGPDGFSYILNSGDRGPLRSLDELSATAASVRATGGASVAAHVDHLRYGLSLMNRWAGGENPFKDADWSTSWRIAAVTDAEWSMLRKQLRDECVRWQAVLAAPRDVSAAELNGMISSIAHLGYHLGAIRQIDRRARGPQDPHLLV